MDRYAFRAGELRRPDGETIGYALVLPMAAWTQIGGHLWWRRWSAPYMTAEVWISADGVEAAYTDAWLEGDVLDKELDLWDRGRVPVGDRIQHAVRWLDDARSAEIARQVFDADLDALRAERIGPVP